MNLTKLNTLLLMVPPSGGSLEIGNHPPKAD